MPNANANVESEWIERVHGPTTSLLHTTRERLWSTSAEWARALMLRSGFIADVPKHRVRGVPRFHLPLPEPDASVEAASIDPTLLVAPSFFYQAHPDIPAPLAQKLAYARQDAAPSPLVWVELPGIALVAGYWVAAELAELSQVRPGERARDLSPRARAVLASIGALVPSGERTGSETWMCGPGPELPAMLSQRGYVVFKQLLPRGLVAALGAHYRYLSESTRLEPDPFSGRLAEKDEPFAQHLLLQLHGFVESLAARPIVATYCYSMWYVRGARLGLHTDNEQCEYSLSLNIDQAPQGSEPWPFCVVGRGGLRITELRLTPGDAVLFRGRTLPHYRRRLVRGEAATGILLHYGNRG